MTWFLMVSCFVAGGYLLFKYMAAEETGLVLYRGGIDDKLDRYQNMIHPDMGILESLLVRQRIKSQIKTQKAINEICSLFMQGEQENYQYQKGKDFREDYRQLEKEQIQDERAQHRIRMQLYALAYEQGMDVLTYLKKIESEVMKKVELDARWREMDQDQKEITRVQLEALERIDWATKRLFTMYKQRRDLMVGKDPAKTEKLRQLEFLIRKVEVAINAEATRFVQDASKEASGGDFSAEDGSGRDRTEDSTDNEPRRGRGRPRGSRNRPADQ